MRNIALFFRDKFIKKAEEIKIESDARQSFVNKSKAITCSHCGAQNFISGNSDCAYCGSALIYIEDDIVLPSAAASHAQNATELSGSHIPNTYALSTGFYIAGIDIPVGKCDVTAISGSGYLSSSDDSISEFFGFEKGDVKSFKGLKLPKDILLNISGELTIKLTYKSIEGGFSGRTYKMSSAIHLSTGNYEAGEDFEAGTYNIVAVSGSGYLSSDNSDVSDYVGLEEDDIREIKHVYFPEGSDLSLEGDLSVKLIPANKN